MNEYLSNKLRIVSLFLMIGVVLAHAYNITTKFDAGNVNFKNGYSIFIQNFFTNGTIRIVIPLFFGISGYLFFLKFNGAAKEFVMKYKKRSKSLFVPYMFWSIWGLLFYFVLQLFPLSKSFFTTELITDYSWGKLLRTLFLDPIPYQLWFVRDLIALVIISPLIYWAVRYLRIVSVVFLFIIWLEIFKFNYIIFSGESILFFSLGAYLAMYKNDIVLKKRDPYYNWILFFLWIVLVAFETLLTNSMFKHDLFVTLIHKLGLLLGSISVWSLYDILMKNKKNPNKFVLGLSSFSFFIYASHEPILTIIKKGIFYVFGTSEQMSLINYFLAPSITIIVSILIGFFIKNYAPKFLLLITGGR